MPDKMLDDIMSESLPPQMPDQVAPETCEFVPDRMPDQVSEYMLNTTRFVRNNNEICRTQFPMSMTMLCQKVCQAGWQIECQLDLDKCHNVCQFKNR